MSTTKIPDELLSSGVGTGASKLLKLDSSGKLPAVDGSNLTGMAIPTLDSPSITGTLSVDSGGDVSHTIANWSDDITYVITPTNCTVGAVNTSGVFVVTHTSGSPSYTIKSTTDSLGLDDSTLVTKNIVMNLSAPTLDSPADSQTLTNVVYTITSTDTGDDKIILDIGSSNFTYQSVSVGSASKVGNTVVCTGFTTNNPAVTIQFTAEATYSVTAKSINIAGTYGDSASSSADSIIIANYMAATGGIVITNGNYKYHIFTGTSAFVVTSASNASTPFDFLVIAGGGAAGTTGTTGGVGAGGGAGGYRLFTSQTRPTAASYPVVIGSGGAGDSGSGYGGPAYGYSGQNSSFNGKTSSGGGGGGGYHTVWAAGRPGGSGGGGVDTQSSGAGNNGGYSPVEGYSGGGGSAGAYGGGGGGASASGGNASNNSGGAGVGGNGSNSAASWITAITAGGGSTYGRNSGYFAGGGAGGSDYGGPAAGGLGGGGIGNPGFNVMHGGNGAGNTGSGGGGDYSRGSYWQGKMGGSGIVIIKYQYQ